MNVNCDFCILGEAVSVFVIPMGILPAVQAGPSGLVELDDGRWNACEGCELLVEQRAKSKLIARVVSAFTGSGMLPSHTRAEIAAIKFNLDRKYAALFGANPTKQPI
ncbi:hypothetical protein [Kitasatospora sp. NPDC059800]|uniref:hypothetical protein n=1 Tax=Kitasatospora sp. NPDC059800 TaxID=3346951 RepID=UPI0036520CC6